MLANLMWLLLAAAAAGGTAEKKESQGMYLSERDLMAVKGQLLAKFGAAEKERFTAGVEQAARLWTENDGTPDEFARFCSRQYLPEAQRAQLLSRFEDKSEQLGGHMNSLVLMLRRELDEDTGPLLPVDEVFAAYDPAAHLIDDFFDNKLAFAVLLNFPAPDLEQMTRDGPGFSRERWAEARLAQQFLHRVPAEVLQRLSRTVTNAGAYIDGYNIRMDKLVDAEGKPLFREGLRLISHWGLRDELKAQYQNGAAGVAHQRVIQTVMERIIRQEIPAAVIDNPQATWDPVKNVATGAPADREPDRRYQMMLDTAGALRALDRYYPDAPTPIDRAFRLEREMSEQRVVQLLEQVLTAPVSKKVADRISKKLGRPLEAFDIWYDGFKARADLNERELDQKVKSRFPTLEAFQKELPAVLGALGFDAETAKYLAERIEADPARGAGHAWGGRMRGEKAHLRTRVPQGGMDYKGFNIAMHELGHCVEQTFSLYRVDHNLLQGVPNNAFTEGFAFVFQARDLDVLGFGGEAKKVRAMRALDTFWGAREIAGVALVDIGVWHWMLEHPKATPAELRAALVEIAVGVWNKHFAPLLGVKDSPLLGIYSHMISYPLYLAHYPVGLIVAYQVEDYFTRRPLAGEMERMCRQGRILPDIWMKSAVGSPVSAEPLIKAAEAALSEF